MITKKTFVETMAVLKKQKQQEDAISALLEDMTGEIHFFNVSDNVENVLRKVLGEVFKDKFDWICWWIYEKDFGENKKIKANGVNKQAIKLDTAEQLYDFLIKEMKK